MLRPIIIRGAGEPANQNVDLISYGRKARFLVVEKEKSANRHKDWKQLSKLVRGGYVL